MKQTKISLFLFIATALVSFVQCEAFADPDPSTIPLNQLGVKELPPENSAKTGVRHPSRLRAKSHEKTVSSVKSRNQILNSTVSVTPRQPSDQETEEKAIFDQKYVYEGYGPGWEGWNGFNGYASHEPESPRFSNY